MNDGRDTAGFEEMDVFVVYDSYAKRTNLHETHRPDPAAGPASAGWLAQAAAEPTAPGLGERERPYRAVFWRACLGTRVYGVYDALRAAAESALPGASARSAALAGLADRRALDKALARLATEGLARAHRDAGGAWIFDVLAETPALSRLQHDALPRGLRAAHLDFLGLTPGFDLPAWWRRAEPTFTPYAARAWGWRRVGG